MIMADVFAVFGTLLALGIALPGLLLTWQLLLPTFVMRAEQRLAQTPWFCFFSGAVFLIIYLIPTTVLFSLPWGGFKLMGFIALLGLLAFTSLGTAGLATLMGQRLHHLGLNSSTAGATIRGAVAMELAAVFPLIGWFIFVPLAFIIALGATLFALLGWMPHPTPRAVIPPNNQEVPASA